MRHRAMAMPADEVSVSQERFRAIGEAPSEPTCLARPGGTPAYVNPASARPRPQPRRRCLARTTVSNSS